MLASINNEIQVISKNINPKLKSEQQVQDRLKEIDNMMNITSLKPAQEREYIKEIDFLKKSLTYVK